MLTEQQIRHYDDMGYVVLPDLLSVQEIDILRRAGARLASPDRPLAEANVFEKGGTAIRVSYAPHKDLAAFDAVARLPRIADKVHQLLGRDIYLFQSRVIYKIARQGDQYQWHQDYASWTNDGIDRGGHHDLVSVMVMLDDTTSDNGCLRFIPGGHRAGLGDHHWDAETTGYAAFVYTPDFMQANFDESKAVDVTGKAGSVVLFAPLMPHASARNHSARGRRNAYFIYNRLDNQPSRPVTREYANPHIVNADRRPLTPKTDDALLRLAAEPEAAR